MPGLITGGYLIRCQTCPSEMVLTGESLVRAQDQAMAAGWWIHSARDLLANVAEARCPGCRNLPERAEPTLGEPPCECGCGACCEPR